jgi:peptide/nickel transport system substrate-binding protein
VTTGADKGFARRREGCRRAYPLVLAAAFCAAGTGCRTAPPPPNAPIVVAVRSSPANLDPGIGVDETSQRVERLVFSSLLKVNEALEVVPDLAIRFETTDSQTYIAEIPAGVRFHDGREMTAEDVAFTFRRLIDPAFTSAKKGAYRDLASVEVIDRRTVAFHLEAPSAAFPVNLVLGIVPAGTGPEAARQPIGSGPYRLTEFVPDDHISLAPFDQHHRGAPANAGVVLKVVPDDTMRGLELRKGDVDLIVNDLAPDLVHDLAQESRLQTVTAPGTDWAYVGMNLRDRTLSDVRVRQALAYAVDTAAIATYLRRGLARPAAGIVPDISWAFAPDATTYVRDVARARSLLDAAGLPDPDGDGPQPRVHLTLKTSTVEDSRLQAAVIQQQLADVGIALDLRSYEFATLMADVVRGNVQLYLLQFVGVTDPDMLRRLFHSSQVPPEGVNRGHYRNPEVDRLIEAAGAALDQPTRRAFYQAAQRRIADDVPVISLWAKTNVAVAQASLSGITLSPTADFSFLQHVARAPSGESRPERR